MRTAERGWTNIEQAVREGFARGWEEARRRFTALAPAALSGDESESALPPPPPPADAFGARLRAARERAGMTRTELADRLGVRYETARAWESGDGAPNDKHLGALLDLFPALAREHINPRAGVGRRAGMRLARSLREARRQRST